jgi:class 3 adenylate cyclase
VAAITAWTAPGALQLGATLGIFPLHPITEHGAHIGVATLTMLLSLGVADQVHRVNLASLKFVPKQFISYLGRASLEEIKSGDAIEDDMTVLFCDIRKFTARCESLNPEDIFSFLNEYLREVVPAIHKNGGFIDKYIGDAIMALFPGPSDGALKAAINIQQTVERFNKKGHTENDLKVGVGLHRGRLMLGTIGDKERMEATVISDVVNVASRLESLTKTMGMSIMFSSEVSSSLENPGIFIIESIGSVEVKGRNKPVEAMTTKGLMQQA